MSNDYDVIIKLVVLGDTSVGKTNLLLRYVNDKFDAHSQPSLGMDYLTKDMEIDDYNIKVQFWDTAGQEKYRSIALSYFRAADGILLIYDLARRETFENIKDWLRDVRENSTKENKIMLVGNKIDLEEEREVTTEEGESFAKENGLFFYETSAKTNEEGCVDEAFTSIIKECSTLLISQYKEKEELGKNRIRKETLMLKESQAKKEKGWCC